MRIARLPSIAFFSVAAVLFAASCSRTAKRGELAVEPLARLYVALLAQQWEASHSTATPADSLFAEAKLDSQTFALYLRRTFEDPQKLHSFLKLVLAEFDSLAFSEGPGAAAGVTPGFLHLDKRIRGGSSK